MGYPFRIWFSGLCHFVLNRDPNALCRLCVVLPYAKGEHCRDHVAGIYHVKRTPDECGRMRIEKGKEIVRLNRQRVAFDFAQREPVAVPDNPDFLNEGLLWMGHIAGGFADQNEEIVGLNPPPSVAAQVLLESSYVNYDPELSVRRIWEIPGTLTGGSLPEIEVADPMFVEFTDVEGASLKVYSIDEDMETTHDLSTVSEILISNRCEQGHGISFGDVRVRQEGEQQITWVQVDTDFKFNFDMLSSSSIAAMRRFMETDEEVFPVPESPLLTIKVAPQMCISAADAPLIEKVLDLLRGATLKGIGTGSGSDCLGSQGMTRFVELDRYIPSTGGPQESEQTFSAFAVSEPRSPQGSGTGRPPVLPPVPTPPETRKR